MQTNIDLSGLKGLHIPLEPNVFPLAVGWWLLILAFIFFVALIYFLYHHWLYSLKHQVWQEYNNIKKVQNTSQMLKQLNQLGKKIAIARFGREKIANLYEDEWVSFMNSLLKNELFSKEYIDLLHKSMYAKENQISEQMRIRILQDYKKWLKAVLKK